MRISKCHGKNVTGRGEKLGCVARRKVQNFHEDNYFKACDDDFRFLSEGKFTEGRLAQ